MSRQDKGAALVLIAGSLLMLMGFAALVIDIGAAMNERRQDQSAADVGALAAAQFAQPNPGCTGSSCKTQAMTNGANEAIAVANASLDNAAAADWSDASRCGSPPPAFTPSPVSNCVAFDDNLRRAWVRIPTIDSPAFFGKVLGVTSLSVSAQAVANTSFHNPGAVLPFLVPGNSASADYNCLKTGPNPAWGECEVLPSIGNFGSMDFYLYGNDDPSVGTTQKCSGDTNGRFTSNLARGVDHPVGIHPTGTGPGIDEEQNCGITSAEPNIVWGQTGVGSGLEPGLLYGGSSYSTTGPWPGLLQDASGVKVRNTGGGNPEAWVDNTPLWSFLKSGLPAPCSGVDEPAEMLTCIGWAKSSTTEIFTTSIIDSPRFGFTPRVWEDDFGAGTSPYHIKGYLPVYLDTLYFGCTSDTCDIVHTVGVADSGSCPTEPQQVTCGTPGQGNKAVNALSSYILHPDLLPPVAKSPSPGSDEQRQFNLSQ